MIVGGDHVIYGDDLPCIVMKEGVYEEDGRPYSLLKCIKQPDPKAAYSPKEPYPVGYLLTYYPKSDWRLNQKNGGAHKYYYRRVFENPCFSDHAADRDQCDMPTLMAPDSWSSRGPIYKIRKN